MKRSTRSSGTAAVCGCTLGKSACAAALASATMLVAANVSNAALTIVPTYAANINADPNATTIKNGIQSALNEYTSRFSDNITVNITFQEGGGLGSSSTPIFQVSYGTIRAALVTDATSTDDATALAHLPNQVNSPVDNQANMWITAADGRAIGLATNSASDGTITLNTSIMNLTRPPGNVSFYDLKAVAMHEIDEVLGMGSGLNLPVGFPRLSRPQDLFRYGAGARSYVATNSDSDATSFFSIDGTTQLARFNQTSGADYGDWFSTGAHTPQVQDAFGTPGSAPDLAVEVRNLDVIGYTLIAVPEPGSAALFASVFVAACGSRGADVIAAIENRIKKQKTGTV